MRPSELRRSTALTLSRLAALLLSAVSSAAEYYVNDSSTAGDVPFPGCATMGTGRSSAPCGTCDRPCSSPQLAYNSNPLAPGDTLYLNTGLYRGASSVPILDIANPTKAGAPGAPLTITGPVDTEGHARRGFGGTPLVVLDGDDISQLGVRIRVSHVTLSGMGITNLACGGLGGTRVLVESTLAPVDGFVISGMEGYGGGCVLGPTVSVSNTLPSCTGCEIRYNRIHDAPEEGNAIHLEGTGDVWVHHNEIYGINTAYPSDRLTVSIFGAPRTRFENNIVRDNGSSGVDIHPCDNSSICGTNPSNDVRIVSNTFRRNLASTTDTYAAELIIDAPAATVQNNIFVANTRYCIRLRFGASLASSDYNGFFLEGSARLAIDENFSATHASLVDWQGTGRDPHSLEADPLFVSDTLLRLRSTAGHVEADGSRVGDAVNSPFLDVGNPTSPFSLETAPNGNRINLGAEGNSAEASYSPVTLSKVSGDEQTGAAGMALAQPLVVKVSLASGAPAPGVPVQFAATSGGGSVSTATVTTDVTGAAPAAVMLGDSGLNTYSAQLVSVRSAGTVTFTAQADGPPGTRTFTIGCGCRTGAEGSLVWAFWLWAIPVLRPWRRVAPDAPVRKCTRRRRRPPSKA
jgi:hypothetical protein